MTELSRKRDHHVETAAPSNAIQMSRLVDHFSDTLRNDGAGSAASAAELPASVS
jgi:hypothetical protein